MVQMAKPPESSTRALLGTVQQDGRTLPITCASHCPPVRVANPLFEEPYALMCARTGLWELGAGNRPGPPWATRSSPN